MSEAIQIENLEQLYSDITPKRWLSAEQPEDVRVWSTLRSVSDIERFITDFQTGAKRIFIVHAGRRSFKSELSKRLLIWYALNHSEQTFIYAGPTIGQTAKIAWEDLKRMVPPYFVRKTKEMELEIQLINGSKIRVAGLDVPERVEGTRLHGIVIDEMGDIKDEVFKINILPALADTGGWCIMCGTPNGCNGEFYEVYSSMISKSLLLPDYGLYHWTTADVRGQLFIEPYKAQMTKLQYEQEWLGLFVQGSGRAYLFDRHKHLSDAVQFNPSLPIDLAADFNVGIMPWSVSQAIPEMTQVIDEIVGRDCSIEHMCNLTKSRIQNWLGKLAKKHPIRFYGDATAQYVRDPSAHAASWSIIKDQFNDWNTEFKLTRQNPRIGDRIALTNARLMTADGKIHCLIHPNVKELVLDFEKISYEDVMSGNKTKTGEERSHASDAFGYLCWHQYKTQFRQTDTIVHRY